MRSNLCNRISSIAVGDYKPSIAGDAPLPITGVRILSVKILRAWKIRGAMKISMLFGGLFYLLRGMLIIFPFLITGLLAALSLHTSLTGDLTPSAQEPLWIIAVASVAIAFMEEQYFREKEYEAFIISIAGTVLVFGMTALFYISAQGDIVYMAYLLLALGIADFILGFEYHKPGHTGRKKVRKA